jgi:hypothetical protein
MLVTSFFREPLADSRIGRYPAGLRKGLYARRSGLADFCGPHVLLSRFERRILRTLAFAYYGAALYYFWHRAWLFGALIFFLSFGVGAIGQSLPHRKHETTSELASGTTLAGEFHGEISNEDSYGLGKAIFKTCALLYVTAWQVLWHGNWKWYSILLMLAAFWPLSFAAFLIVTVGPIDIVRNARTQHRLY